MANMKATNYEEFEAELLQDPEVRKEYESLKPKYDMIRTVIKRRNELHISQTQLGKLIGKQQPAIARLENGAHNITMNTFLKAIDALDLDISLKPRNKTKQTSAQPST